MTEETTTARYMTGGRFVEFEVPAASGNETAVERLREVHGHLSAAGHEDGFILEKLMMDDCFADDITMSLGISYSDYTDAHTDLEDELGL